jgi:hypothetical protein
MWCDFECHKNNCMVNHKCPYNYGGYTMNKIVYIHIQVHPNFDDIISFMTMVICDLSKATKRILFIIVIFTIRKHGPISLTHFIMKL